METESLDRAEDYDKTVLALLMIHIVMECVLCIHKLLDFHTFGEVYTPK